MSPPPTSNSGPDPIRVAVMQGADRWIGVLEDLQVTPSHATAVLRFVNERAPVLGLGSVRPIEFLGDNDVRAEFSIPGRVVLVHREKGGIVVFHFEIDHEQTTLINPRGGRRQHCRVEPAPGTVQAWIRVPGSHVEVAILDISPAGVGCVFHSEGEGSLVAVWQTEINIQLPTLEEPIRICADIRRRLLRRKSVHYGLEFDWAETLDAENKERKLTSYLHRRELEILRNLRAKTKRTDAA